MHITSCTLYHTTNQNFTFVCSKIISKHNDFAHVVYSLDFNELHKWISKIPFNSNRFCWTTSFNHHFIAQDFSWPLELLRPDFLIQILLKGMRIYAWNSFSNKQINKQTIIRICVWAKEGKDWAVMAVAETWSVLQVLRWLLYTTLANITHSTACAHSTQHT